MALREINIDLDDRSIKTYASEGNLRRRLEECATMYEDCDDRAVVVRTPAGRWTAIVYLDRSAGGYVGRYSGFVTI